MVSHISEGILFARTGTHMRQRRNSAKVGGRGGSVMAVIATPKEVLLSSFVDPDWFQCGSGYSFLSQRGSRSREPNQCGSGSWSEFHVTKGWIYTRKIYLMLVIGQKTHLRSKKVQKLFWKAGNQVYLYILSNFHAHGTGSAFSKRIRIQDIEMNADPDPQHYFWDFNSKGLSL